MSFFSNLSVGVLAAVMTATVAAAQGTASMAPRDSFALSAPLPTDAAVRIGTLPNGIRYYIRRNAKPEQRADSSRGRCCRVTASFHRVRHVTVELHRPSQNQTSDMPPVLPGSSPDNKTVATGRRDCVRDCVNDSSQPLIGT